VQDEKFETSLRPTNILFPFPTGLAKAGPVRSLGRQERNHYESQILFHYGGVFCVCAADQLSKKRLSPNVRCGLEFDSDLHPGHDR
jgi:hypothetical protein